MNTDQVTDLKEGGMTLEEQLKGLIIAELKIKDIEPADLTDDDPLFGGKLGLDSLDAVELVVVLKKHFGIDIKDRNEARVCFETIATMAAHIRARRNDV